MFKEINFDDVKDIKAEEYFKDNQYAVNMFNSKYAVTKDDGEKETPAEVFYRISDGLSKYENDNKEYYRDIWFSLMYDGWFRPGGSIISTIGINKKCSTMNCTTIPIEDDSLESIAKAEYTLMKCAAYRQGMGIDLSNLRPRGSKLGNAAEESTGVVPWVEKFNNVGEYVGQKGRIPAILESLRVHHPDIEEFINCKRTGNKIKNANISVQITDSFMEHLKSERPWTLWFDTNHEEIRKEVDPEYIINMIADAACNSAEPGVQFIDRLRKGTLAHAIYEHTGNPIYKIISSNACSEKILPPYGVCLLLSINMEKFSTDKKTYKKELEYIVPYLVRLCDNVTEYELENDLSPVPEQRNILEKLREIGMGITNLHGWLLKDNIQYDSDQALEMSENFMKHYSYNVFKTSVDLGKEKGNAPAFDEIKDKSILMNSIYFRNIINGFYEGDYNKITTLRNISNMSCAPVGSISNSFPTPCISSGGEPIIGPYYWRKTKAISKNDWDYYFTIPLRVKEYILNFIPKDTEDYNRLYNFSGSELDNDGKIGLELIEIIEKYITKGFFKPAHEIDPMKKLDLLAGLYKWVDAAISCTFNLPVSATKEDVKNIYLQAYEKGVRAVSVYREGCREGVLIFEDPITNKKKYDKENLLCMQRPENIKYSCAPVRPQELSCNIHHTTVKGEKWLVIIGLLNGLPYELFAGPQEDLYLPKSVENGIITKNGGGLYNLNIKIKKMDVEYKDIADILMGPNERSMTRLISTGLRHGVPVEFISQQLKKTRADITEFASAVSRILGKYETMELSVKSKCPNCGEPMVNSEGCIKCINEECGYSRCG